MRLFLGFSKGSQATYPQAAEIPDLYSPFLLIIKPEGHTQKAEEQIYRNSGLQVPFPWQISICSHSSRAEEYSIGIDFVFRKLSSELVQ